jgi:cytosine/adenosine deaminase-related metal-dependent hydrolase
MKGAIRIHADKAFIGGKMQSASWGPDTAQAIRLDDRYLLLPGLINAHDHLHFNSFPLLGGTKTYADMYEWTNDIEAQRSRADIRAALRIPIEDRLQIGGLKNLISGVTTVVHHDDYHPCLDQQFPVRVLRNYSWSHSLGLDFHAVETFRRAAGQRPWMIHAAEGSSDRASGEIDEMDRLGMIAGNTLLVHALAATASQIEIIRNKRAGIVACPVSNQFLYGRTINFKSLPPDVRLALGSDSAATSSPGILSDLQALRRLVNWSEEKIWSLLTTSPAEMLGVPVQSADAVVLRDGVPVLVVVNGDIRLCETEFEYLPGDRPLRITINDRVKFISREVKVPLKSLRRAAEWTPYLSRWRF